MFLMEQKLRFSSNYKHYVFCVPDSYHFCVLCSRSKLPYVNTVQFLSIIEKKVNGLIAISEDHNTECEACVEQGNQKPPEET